MTGSRREKGRKEEECYSWTIAGEKEEWEHDASVVYFKI